MGKYIYIRGIIESNPTAYQETGKSKKRAKSEVKSHLERDGDWMGNWEKNIGNFWKNEKKRI